MISAFGFNGFNQISDLVEHDLSPIEAETITSPCRIQVNQHTTDAEYDCTVDCTYPGRMECDIQGNPDIKDVCLSWDRILLIFDDGQWVTSGFHSKLKAEGNRGTRVISGCLSWNKAVLCDSTGTLSITCLNQKDDTWRRVQIDNELSLDLDQAESIDYVVGGGKHVFAVTDSKRVASLETTEGSATILRPINLAVAVKDVTCGKEHTLLLSRIGVVFSFGIGGQGQLGHGTIESINTPRVIEAVEAVSMVSVAAGGWHSVAVSDIGDIYIWGWNERGQLGFPSKLVRQESQGSRSATDAQSDGKHEFKEFQSDRRTRDDLVNILTLPALLDLDETFQNVTVSKVSCGSRHTAAVTESGSLFTWGWNKYGQLGHGDRRCRDRPSRVAYYHDNRHVVTRVWCGAWTTVVLSAEGHT